MANYNRQKITNGGAYGRPGMFGLINKVQFINNMIARDHNLLPGDLKRKTRAAVIRHPRQICMTLILKHTNWTSIKTAWFYDMDHSTVLHAQGVIKDELSYNEALKSKYMRWEKKILSNYTTNIVKANNPLTIKGFDLLEKWRKTDYLTKLKQ